MATTPGYDPKKAAAYNKLRQLGLGEDQAARQAGISPAEDDNYVVNEVGSNNPKDASFNPNFGKMGPPVMGANFNEYNKAIASGKTEEQAFAELEARRGEAKAERAAIQKEQEFLDGKQGKPRTFDDTDDNEDFERVDYATNEKTPPNTRVVTQTVTTETETVSGGGTKTTTAGPRTPNPASASLQQQINAKQAEQSQFIKDNPSDLVRKKQGLPPMTPEERAERQRGLDKISAEKSDLTYKQENEETPGGPTVTVVPNTTTTTETVTSGTTSTNSAVVFTNDEQLFQQTEGQIDAQGRAPNANTAAAAAPVTPEELGNDYGFTSEEVDGADAVELGEPETVDDPFEAARLEAEAEINDNPIDADPADVDPDDDPFEAERLEREQEQNRQELAETDTEPEPVGPEELGNEYGFTSEEDEDALIPLGEPEPVALSAEDIAAQDAQQAANRAELQAADAQEAAAQQAATLEKARAQNTIAQQRSNKNNADWRVKLRLAPLADYLYMAKPPGILAPLAPDGVIFPYTPTIQTSYKATYATTDITHSNYRGYFYQGSAVEPFTISSTFTAQSTAEAEYLLAVIHFFKSVTKMFYGQDPQRGTPPPLVYLTGLGEFQFNEHPCVVSGFTYDLPADVDYIRAYSPNVNNSNMLQQRQSNNSTGPGTSWGNGILGGVLGGAVNRLATSKLFNGQPLPKGGQNIPPPPQTLGSNTIPTYVPTKMTIAVSLLPVVSRQAQSQRFSVRQYATGDLQKGGMW